MSEDDIINEDDNNDDDVNKTSDDEIPVQPSKRRRIGGPDTIPIQSVMASTPIKGSGAPLWC